MPKNRIVLLHLQVLTLLLVFFPVVAPAQSSVPRFEVGPLFTCLSRILETCDRGVGGRGTFNVTKFFAAEFQTSHIRSFDFAKGMTYGSGHAKVTLRMEERFKFNAFGIVGPGFIRFNRFVGKPPAAISEERVTAGAFNLGGGLEIVPARWISARFDFSDFVSNTQCQDAFCDQTTNEHRFDFKAGAMFRFR